MIVWCQVVNQVMCVGLLYAQYCLQDVVGEKQARLQSDFKDEPEDEEEYLWAEVQDAETGQTYYWNNDAEVLSCDARLFDIITRLCSCGFNCAFS